MRSLTYLNLILTAIAVLLGLHLYTAWSQGGAPLGVTPAQAQVVVGGGGGGGGAVVTPDGGPKKDNTRDTFPNANAQFKDITDSVKALGQKVDDLTTFLKSGQLKVVVDKLPDAKGGK